MHDRLAKMNARGRILVGSWGSQGAREACKNERLRPDSSRVRRSDGAREGCQIERLGPDSEGAREACKNERLRPDSSRELGVAGCAGSVQK